MMAAQTADANPDRLLHWPSVNWVQAEETVRRLQARIVKALKENALRKVKDLQRLLARSLSARLLAVKRVTTNKGRKTPGVDGITWTTPEQKTQAVHDLGKDIQTLPLRRIYIPKKNGKMRPISIPSMLNRAQQACHLLTLDPVAETSADQRSYGFRVERGAHDAIGYIYHILRRKGSPQWILEGDIKSCFDEINHEWLKENVHMDKSVLQEWLKSGFMEGKKLFPTKAGTPQGGIASPTLANITLDGLEKTLIQKFGYEPGNPDSPWKNIKNMVHLCRYADDFIVTGNSKELLQEQVLPTIKQFLLERGLQISEEKTRITHITEGFDFLGQNTRKYGEKVLTTPSKKSLLNLTEKLSATVKEYHGHSASDLIKAINPIIRGWCNYHRFIVSRKVFEKVDNHVFQILWKWARRQHPKKNRQWVAKKYFHHPDGKKWVFSAKAKRGKVKQQYLASSTTIRRHILIKGKANPYDAEWRAYFEKRAQRKSVPCAV
jgi:RNA-directed DNA polymerase